MGDDRDYAKRDLLSVLQQAINEFRESVKYTRHA